jgi:hypothetical protein
MRHFCLAMLAVLSATPVLADDYAQRLTAVAYDGAMRANVQGDGHVTATLDGRKLTVQGDFSALPSAATSAKLYSGPGIGVPGPALLDLQLTGQTDGTFQGSFTLNTAQLAALKRGHVYVQINSQKAPEGNLWGWLLPAHPFAGPNVPVEGHGFLPQLDVPGNWTEK